LGDSDNEQVYFDAAFGAIGGTGTVGTFGVVRGKGVFCCLFEEERVNAGIEQLRKVECKLELEDFEYKEKKINF
jgi:translation initiation factor 6 (eIF-6)